MNIRYSCAVLLLTVAAPVLAGSVYQWTDAQGHTHYGDQPAQGARKLMLEPGTSQAAPAAETQGAAAQQAADCKRQRDQLAIYKSATNIIEKDALGNNHEYSGDERKKLIEQAQSKTDTACANQPPADASAPESAESAPR
ncbi:MAG: DUF4124 domain-containing protein [Stenotrophobium sp.]